MFVVCLLLVTPSVQGWLCPLVKAAWGALSNAAYPARMAYETARLANDAQWTREVALPIIRASATFFADHLTKGDSGTWDLHVTPSMSQDELAKPDQSNYLCALYAARYCFKIATQLGETTFAPYLEDGLSFHKLLDAQRNLYRTSEKMDESSWGTAKHPVQLNPLVFLPFTLDDAERNAYAQREALCESMKTNISYGWTAASFWLAAAHMEDGQTLLRELQRATDPRFHDAEELTFYETTGVRDCPYFITTHGLWMQAVLDAFVCDYNGCTRLQAAVPVQWKGAQYCNLYTLDGVCHSGTVE